MDIPTLDAESILRTVQVLQQRIEERFPGSGLSRACGQLAQIAEQAKERSEWIGRPIPGLRPIIVALGVFLVAALAATLVSVRVPLGEFSLIEFIQIIESGINDLVFVGIAIFFLATLEIRIKRKRALEAIHELRVVAHIIDIHQLTKDPERLLKGYRATKTSPRVTRMSVPQLRRYLDYCSEMLSLIGKIAALYIQHFNDGQAIASVNEVENLTTGLSRKVWQKIMILHSLADDRLLDPVPDTPHAQEDTGAEGGGIEAG